MKAITRIISLVSALFLLVGATFLFGSCGGDEPPAGPISYSVTVVDESGVGIKNALVRFKVGNVPTDKRTNVAGVASIEVPAEKASQNVTVEIVEPPVGYSASTSPIAYTDGKTSVTVVAVKTVKYTVNVLADGWGVEGASVRLFIGDTQFGERKSTDMNGVVEFYIPETDEEVTAKLTVPIGYTISGTNELTFGSDKTVSFTLDEQAKYTINTIDIQGKVVTGIELFIYRKSDGELILNKKVSDNGVLTFYGEKTDYRIVVKGVNPAVVFSGDSSGDDEEVYADLKATDSTKILFFVHVETPIEYKVNLKDSAGNPLSGVTVNLLNTRHEVVYTAVSGADGVAVFNVPNGNYIASAICGSAFSCEPVSFKVDEKVVADMVFNNTYLGANESSPAQIFDNDSNILSIPAGAGAWYYVASSVNRSLKLTDASGIKLVYNGNEYLPTSGVINVSLLGDGESVIKIVNTTASDVQFNVSVNKLGGIDSPINMPIGTDFDIVLMTDEIVYYTFTASGNKTLVLNFSGKYSDLAVATVGGIEVSSVVLKNGESVTVAFGAISYEDGRVEYTVNASFEERYIDYTVNVQIEGAYDLSALAVQLYRDGIKMDGVTALVNENGVAVFENILEYSGYTVRLEAIPEGYEVIHDDVSFEGSTVGLSVTLIPDGSRNSPYDIQAGSVLDYLTEGGEAWFEINVRIVGEYLVKIIGSGVNVEIFGADGVSLGKYFNQENGYASYVFNGSSDNSLGEGVYMLKVTADGESVSVYANTLGYDANIPHKIEAAGEVVATVKEDGGLVYYEYTGALNVGDTVTVATAEAIILVGGVADDDGMVSFTYSGERILFAISAELADNYDFTVSVEKAE